MRCDHFKDRLYSLKTQKKFGLPNELGFITLGISKLGDYNPMAGIYQTRTAAKYAYDNENAVLSLIILGQNKLGSPNFKKTDNQFNKKIIVRMKHYYPPNTQSDLQQTWRSYFATVLSSWQAMSENDKNIWRSKSYPAHMSGWNRYAKVHLNARDL